MSTMTRHDSDTISHIHQELRSHLPSEPALRVKALESLLVEKAMVDSKTVDAWVEVYSDEIGPKRGAQVVARAWVDPQFKARLLENGAAAVKELGFEGNHLRALAPKAARHGGNVCFVPQAESCSAA
jgi:nitrile hydratase subunit alpha